MKKIISIILLLIFSSCNLKLMETKSKKTEYTFPIYGNHCGDYSPPKGSDLIAIDEVDEACKDFDYCQESLGIKNQICYIKLYQNLFNVSSKNSSESLARRLIINYLKNKIPE